MRRIETTFQTFGASMLLIGLKGESNATEILIDCADALEEYQGTMTAMSITGPDGTVYPGEISLDENGTVHWVVAARDCFIEGKGSARVDLVDDNGTVVASAEATTIILKTNMQNSSGTEPPDQIADWADAASIVLQNVQQALTDLAIVQTNETARQLAETGRVSAEQSRVSHENSRVAAENNRVIAEFGRGINEDGRVTAEDGRVTAENGRVTAESGRVTAESGRVTAESGRVTAESGRVTAENGRVTAESGRVTAESARVQAETGRVNTESQRVQAETGRVNAETARVQAETGRVNAETARVSEFNTIRANAQAALSYLGESENSSTASAAHAAGSYLIYNGELYKVTADIAIGDALSTSGASANIAEVPAGAMGEVSHLKSALTNKAPVIINSASGSIASFDDGADGMPVKELVVGIEPVQEGTGDPSPDNVRPITGWTGANVWGTGRNLVKTKDAGRTNANVEYTVNSDGSITASGTATATSWFRAGGDSTVLGTLLKAGTYKLSGGKSNDKTLYIVGKYIDGTGISNSTVTGGVYDKGSGLTFTLTKDAWILYQIQINNGQVADDTFYPMIRNADDTDTTWEPCTPATLPITFPASAGTVYGGSLTVNEDGTGRLVVNRAEVDLGTLTWTYDSESYSYGFFWALLNPEKAQNYNFICSRYANREHKKSNIENCEVGIYNSNTSGFKRIIVRDDSFTDVSTFTAAMSGVQLVYELATPLTYDLTAIEVMETLKGANNIWADCGPISVDYRADTKAYVDNASPDIPVTDVQVNGTSVVTDGVANVPIATSSSLGVVKTNTGFGTAINTNTGELFISGATESDAKSGTQAYKPVIPKYQHNATFYGLAKAAGDSTQSSSSNAVGTYTESAKSAISTMLNGSVSISGTTPSITALPGVRYVCGECATLTIAVPASGIIDVVFESGSTATVLTVTPPTGMTMKWIGEDPTALEANKTYEINIKDGCLGMVVSWT